LDVPALVALTGSSQELDPSNTAPDAPPEALERRYELYGIGCPRRIVAGVVDEHRVVHLEPHLRRHHAPIPLDQAETQLTERGQPGGYLDEECPPVGEGELVAVVHPCDAPRPCLVQLEEGAERCADTIRRVADAELKPMACALQQPRVVLHVVAHALVQSGDELRICRWQRAMMVGARLAPDDDV